MDTNFTRGAPYKIWEGKNVQNSARFLTTVDFYYKYLRNGSTYWKSDKYLINYVSSPIGWKKFGELWSTNNKVIDAHIDPPKWTFWETIFRPVGTLALKFLHVLLAPLIVFPVGPGAPGRPHVGLCPIFLVFYILSYVCYIQGRTKAGPGLEALLIPRPLQAIRQRLLLSQPFFSYAYTT